ncbi:sugar ABC transporter permease [Crossiella sp. SN42]|uniref:carbohydrate ABC transporter permease n=1 Tax=Crossiella sp. SN42 TaxID=2944808 RepID=UPI00207D0593|nr:sugar ABC transporter permease [Crossiella sp. SN42]MCO1579912.1 sugar ABC transporter permease [Crossiella sp. SN42]
MTTETTPRPSFVLRRNRGLFITACLAPALLLVGLFTYYPMIRGGVISFQNYTLFDLSSTDFIGWGNFEKVLAEPGFWTALANTGIWVLFSLTGQFVLGFALALLLQKAFRGRGLYQALVFFPWAMSGFLIGLVWRWMFNAEFGVVNDLLLRLGVVDAPIAFLASPEWAQTGQIIANIWYGVTFFSIMILAALQSVPQELYEAARLDGASYTQALLRVVIPFIRPTLVLVVLLRVIWILNFPDIIYAMTDGGPAGKTHIITTYMINKIIGAQDYGQASAVGLIVLVLLFAFTVFYLAATRLEKSRDF